MEKYRRGTIIRLMRNALNMTQEELIIDDNGEEICSLKTLSNVENGKQKLGKEAYGRIMNKLGSAIRKSDLLLATSEIKVFEKKKELHRMLRNQEYESAKILLEEIKDDLDMESPFNRQYYLYNKAIIYYKLGISNIEKYETMLTEAIKCTIKKYDEIIIEKWPYTIVEATILMNIATVLDNKGETINSLRILFGIKKALEQNYLDDSSLSKIKIVLCNNISNFLGNIGDWDQAIKIDIETIEYSKNIKNFGKISDLLYDIVWNKSKIGDIDNKEVIKKTYLIKAYYIAKAINNVASYRFLRDKLK